MPGGSVSLTVTVKVQLLLLPAESVAVHVTGVVPVPKVEPVGGLQVTVTPAQLSVAAGAYPTTCVHRPGALLVAILAGQTTTGGSVSLTVTVKLQLLVLPAASVAVQLTGVVPMPKLEPVGGLQLTATPAQLSVAAGA